MSDLKIFLIYAIALILVMLLAEMAYRWLKLDTEWTRKIAHVGSGIVALTYPKFIDNHWVVLALTLSFTFILYFSKKMGWFQSIFSIERKSYGELFFVWTTWFLFLIFQATGNPIYYYIPFAIVVFADPAAALIGKSLPLRTYEIKGHQKSFGGSLSFFIVSLFIMVLFFPASDFSGNFFTLFVVIMALILTLVEAFSFKGLDNLSIPIVALFLLKILMQ